MHGSVIFSPIDELLPEARVLELLPQLFRFHKVVLKFLHILKY